MPDHDLDLILRGGLVVSSYGAQKGDVGIRGDRIVGIGSLREKARREVDCSGKLILPGFVDVHTNGAAGFDMTYGLYEMKEERFVRTRGHFEEGLRQAIRHYVAHGVTSLYLTTIAAPLGGLTRSLRGLARFVVKEPAGPIRGAFVEGTFIKSRAQRGAQNPRYFRPLQWEIFEALQEAAEGLIRRVNVPPEHGEDAFRFIRRLRAQGIVPVAGHTGATANEIRRATQAGLRSAVHFLNGPTGSSAKPFGGGGAVEGILGESELFVEMIVDGFHVAPAYVRDVLARKGIERFIAVTDSMFAAGLDDLQRFRMGGVEGRVAPGGEYLQVADRPDVLFGSLLTMDRAFANLVTWLTSEMDGVWHRRHQPLEEREALRWAVMATSTNPARLMELGDTGDLLPGRRADVIVGKLGRTTGRYALSVEMVLSGGEMVYKNLH